MADVKRGPQAKLRPVVVVGYSGRRVVAAAVWMRGRWRGRALGHERIGRVRSLRETITWFEGYGARRVVVIYRPGGVLGPRLWWWRVITAGAMVFLVRGKQSSSSTLHPEGGGGAAAAVRGGGWGPSAEWAANPRTGPEERLSGAGGV